MKAYLTAYRYDGPHRNYDRRRGRFVAWFEHWDWRYKIVVNGVTVQYRQGFCTHEAAAASLERSWLRMSDALARGYLRL